VQQLDVIHVPESPARLCGDVVAAALTLHVDEAAQDRNSYLMRRAVRENARAL
jgi:hypothetical protein